MTQQISEREVVGVRLVTLELSEGELEVLTSCLNYVLDHVDHQHLERVTGAYPNEVMAIRDDLRLSLADSSLDLPDDEMPALLMQEPT